MTAMPNWVGNLKTRTTSLMCIWLFNPLGFQGEVLGLSSESSTHFSEWQAMSPLVECDDDVMVFTASGQGFTHLSVDRGKFVVLEDMSCVFFLFWGTSFYLFYFFVPLYHYIQREGSPHVISIYKKLKKQTPQFFTLFVSTVGTSPISVFQLPPYCGYTLRTSWSDLEMMVPYDACYITQEVPAAAFDAHHRLSWSVLTAPDFVVLLSVRITVTCCPCCGGAPR